jgi:hypothetical protein
MTGITVLIDKLTDIERSIGVETDFAIRSQVVAAQDCALRLQGEIAEIFRRESERNADQIESDLSLNALLGRCGWRRAFAAIQPLDAVSPLWRQ